MELCISFVLLISNSYLDDAGLHPTGPSTRTATRVTRHEGSGIGDRVYAGVMFMFSQPGWIQTDGSKYGSNK